ncbi:unnamed protein product [Timema podura]|uniref:RNA polymerase alpha subunit n=1 Tax=Timema podura TaxID=61482 RepID=A0ABN7NSL8_TIMPD|nr:unnamed protein product [Timema podura]
MFENSKNNDGDNIRPTYYPKTELTSMCKMVPLHVLLLAKCPRAHRTLVWSLLKQCLGEPFENFYAELRALATPCEFGDQENKLLRAQIKLGVNSKNYSPLNPPKFRIGAIFIKQDNQEVGTIYSRLNRYGPTPNKILLFQETSLVKSLLEKHVIDVVTTIQTSHVPLLISDVIDAEGSYGERVRPLFRPILGKGIPVNSPDSLSVLDAPCNQDNYFTISELQIRTVVSPTSGPEIQPGLLRAMTSFRSYHIVPIDLLNFILLIKLDMTRLGGVLSLGAELEELQLHFSYMIYLDQMVLKLIYTSQTELEGD